MLLLADVGEYSFANAALVLQAISIHSADSVFIAMDQFHTKLLHLQQITWETWCNKKMTWLFKG